MAELPGRRTQSNVQIPAGEKHPTPKGSQPEVGVEVPTHDQLQALHEELIQQDQLAVQTKLEEVRQKREQELQKGKPKKIEKINIEDLKFAKEERRGGLPERIRKLPKDHPVRVLYERGFKQKSERFKRRNIHGNDSLVLKEALIEISKIVLWLLLILGVAGGIYRGTQKYKTDTEDTRQKILLIIKEKNYSPDHPKVSKAFKELYWSNWLPDLKKLLAFINSLNVNFEVFDGNPEPGSYTEYIKRHNKPFNQSEAMEWYAREIRKPAWVTNQ